MRHLSLYLTSLIFFAAGLNHFINPEFYLKLMPPYLPMPDILNLVAGAAEMVFAVGLLFPKTRAFSAWGLVAVLIAVFPANIYMYQERTLLFPDVPTWVMALRLPLQGLMIWWVYQFAGPKRR
jgi:uncharacterized membrane protein